MSNTIVFPPQHGNGWILQADTNTLTIDRDSQANIEDVRQRLALIRKRCACKTGCRTGHCGCTKRERECGPGCSCVNCSNLHVQDAREEQMDMEVLESVEARGSESETEDIDEMMYRVFGPDTLIRYSDDVCEVHSTNRNLVYYNVDNHCATSVHATITDLAPNQSKCMVLCFLKIPLKSMKPLLQNESVNIDY